MPGRTGVAQGLVQQALVAGVQSARGLIHQHQPGLRQVWGEGSTR